MCTWDDSGFVNSCIQFDADGIFSVVYTVSSGSLSANPSAQGVIFSPAPATAFIAGALFTPAVPEPGTLALLAVALVGAGVTRWRARH